MKGISSRPRLTRMVSSMLLLGAVGPALLAHAQGGQDRGRQTAAQNTARQERNGSGGEIHLLHVQGNIGMLVGAGGNITVQAGDDGILLVDTGLATMSDKVIEAIRPLSRKPLFYIINTDEREDHTGGNENIGKVGRPISRGATGAYIIAFVTVLDRMSDPNGQGPHIPDDS